MLDYHALSLSDGVTTRQNSTKSPFGSDSQNGRARGVSTRSGMPQPSITEALSSSKPRSGSNDGMGRMLQRHTGAPATLVVWN